MDRITSDLVISFLYSILTSILDFSTPGGPNWRRSTVVRAGTTGARVGRVVGGSLAGGRIANGMNAGSRPLPLVLLGVFFLGLVTPALVRSIDGFLARRLGRKLAMIRSWETCNTNSTTIFYLTYVFDLSFLFRTYFLNAILDKFLQSVFNELLIRCFFCSI